MIEYIDAAIIAVVGCIIGSLFVLLTNSEFTKSYHKFILGAGYSLTSMFIITTFIIVTTKSSIIDNKFEIDYNELVVKYPSEDFVIVPSSLNLSKDAYIIVNRQTGDLFDIDKNEKLKFEYCKEKEIEIYKKVLPTKKFFGETAIEYRMTAIVNCNVKGEK